MLIASEVRPAGSWDPRRLADQVLLDFDGRHRRRHAMTGRDGLCFVLDLPKATALRHGDGLVLPDGRIVAVEAAPERLLEITASDAAMIVRIAWHLGNRHLPTQVGHGTLRIREDHVIHDMVVGLGGAVTHLEAPFDPEGGAFHVAGVHGH